MLPSTKRGRQTFKNELKKIKVQYKWQTCWRKSLLMKN